MPYLWMGGRSQSLYTGFDGRSRRASNNLLEDSLLLPGLAGTVIAFVLLLNIPIILTVAVANRASTSSGKRCTGSAAFGEARFPRT